MRTIPTPHELLVDRCLALAGAMQNPVRHRRYLERLNDRQLEERANALRVDQQERLVTGQGHYCGQAGLRTLARAGAAAVEGGAR